jgi:tetratricopeptide (TPR) repeat protein
LEPSLPARNWLPAYSAYISLALAQSRQGQHEEAATSTIQARTIAAQSGGHLLLDDWLSAFDAEMALNAGRRETALDRAQEAVAKSADGVFAQAFAHRVWAQALATLDPPRWDEAETHLTTSLELFVSGEARLEAARTHVAWGQVLQARGDFDAAREHYQKAAAQFEATGLARELEKTRELTREAPHLPRSG